ncbi:NAD(P)-dependent oxidoreductase [Flavihumibacter stibioxidans]|uniref:NAD(P)-binding domain-containing protein n=1 Tax=Flavihumibacter stibioxidans TaxID=1834163 RepID=A0ABR7MBT4_9BACT|nr:SDR family oxidoreductase [Flavihumibacter stibioxidans]MBC6492299.1 hypothetical protein [Flavihumibacter stibioxidans]
MNITVFGATGQVGRHVVNQALLKNHFVRAFGRNVHELKDINKNLELVRGGVFDTEDIFRSLKDCDAVISVLGGSFDGQDKTRSLGMKNIIAQMKNTGVIRIVALGGKGILDHPDGGLIIDQPEYPEEYLPVGREHQKAWEELLGSGLNWTFVCSPDIIDADPQGNFITAANVFPEGAQSRINSGDLALFMLQEIEQEQYPKQRVGIGMV